MSNLEQLKKVGLKVTVPRTKILAILSQPKERHLTAEAIYRQLRDAGHDVGLATVYRVLTQFEAAGLVVRHHFEEGHSTFELNQGEHHDHLVCMRCGQIEEFRDEMIEERQLNIAKTHGFEMHDHALNIYGLCPKCQSAPL